MPRDSPIIGRVTDENGNIIARKTFQWLAGMRALKIDIDVNSQGDNVVLQVSSRNPADNLLKDSDDAILSVWSPPFVLNKNFQIDGLVERRLGIGHERVLSIWEEPGESIARHIWDGGFAITKYFVRMFSNQENGALGAFDELLKSNVHLNVLELGSGCGIVGLSIAQLRGNCNVTLTDLSLASEIIRKNIQQQKQAIFQVLDWDSEVPEDISSQNFNIIVIADCMYNVDAAPALVGVVTQLIRTSPHTHLVIAHKKRHGSEEQFFVLLKDAGMVLKANTRLGIEDNHSGLQPEGVELYVMQSCG